MARTGFVFHESSLRHVCGHRDHPESAARIESVRSHLASCGLIEQMDEHHPNPAPRALLELAHDGELVDLLEELDRRGGGQIDLDTGMGPGSLEATLRGTQGTVDAAARVLRGDWESALVCMRPPGHHATTRRPMGFCLTNHVAIAARWAVLAGGISRAAVIDWDAHHGNGSQDIFWTDPNVLYVSLHQYPWYPGTGDATERGEGDGAGTTINVPLPAGAAEDAYAQAFDDVVEPAVRAFAPELVLVSAGYDAHYRDPLCMMRLTAGAFGRFARRIVEWGPGPVCVLEGGYDLDALAWSVAATVSALVGCEAPVGVPDAELEPVAGTPEALRWVDRAATVIDG